MGIRVCFFEGLWATLWDIRTRPPYRGLSCGLFGLGGREVAFLVGSWPGREGGGHCGLVAWEGGWRPLWDQGLGGRVVAFLVGSWLGREGGGHCGINVPGDEDVSSGFRDLLRVHFLDTHWPLGGWVVAFVCFQFAQ